MIHTFNFIKHYDLTSKNEWTYDVGFNWTEKAFVLTNIVGPICLVGDYASFQGMAAVVG